MIRKDDMPKFFTRFLRDEAGATSIEYGLIITMVAVVIITAVNTLGKTVSGKFTSANTKLNAT